MRLFIRQTINWLPRILGVLFSVFLGLFATDVFNEVYKIRQAVGAFIIHLLPSIFLFTFTLIGWRWPRWGAFLFAITGLIFVMYFKNPWPIDIILAGPQFLVAILFGINFLLKNKQKSKEENVPVL